MIRRMQSSWNALATRDRRSLTIFAVFLVAVTAYLAVIEPVFDAFDGLIQKKRELENSIEKNQSAALSVYRRRAKLEEVRNESAYLVEKLGIENSGADTLGELLYEVKLYGQEAGVAIDQITPLEMTDKTGFQELPLLVRVNGTYAAVSKFIYFVETSPLVLVISDLQMQGQDDQVAARLQVNKVSIETVEGEIADSYLNVLRIGLEHWIGFAPFYVAKKQGWLTDQDINVQLIQGTDTDQLAHLMRSGDLDGLCLPLTDLIAGLEAGFQLKGIYPLAWSSGGNAIVVAGNTPGHSLKELEDVDIYGAGRVAQYIVYRAFTAEKLPFSPQRVHNLSSPLVLQSLSTDMIQAGVLWEPYLSLFQQEQLGRTVFDSDKLSKDCFETVVVREDVLKDKHEAVAFLLQALEKATKWIAAHPDEAGQLIAEQLHMPDAAVRKGFEGVHYLSPEEQQTLVGCAGNSQTLGKAIKQQEQFLQALYQKKVSLPAGDFFDWSVIRPMIGCQQKPGPGRKDN